jgi:hypothetical protein
VEAVAKRLRNLDTGKAALTAQAMTARQPAYWRTTDYSDAHVSSLLWYAGECGSLAAGNRRMNADYRSNDELTETVLDRFIPMNEPAVREMLDLYEMAGTFRDAAELRRREPAVVGVAA